MKRVLPVLLALSALTTARAAQVGDTLQVTFQGNFIVYTTCSFNNNQEINVDFGNTSPDSIDGIHNAQTIPFNTACPGATDSSPLHLKVGGTASAFDTSAVAASASGLGIRILQNGTAITLNQEWITTVGAMSSLTLTAVPVKDPSVTLSEQAFTASATLTAEYE